MKVFKSFAARVLLIATLAIASIATMPANAGVSFSTTVRTEWYAVDPKILKIRNVIDQATGLDIPVIPVEKMRQLGLRFDGTTGPLKALISGLQKGFLRAYPVPSVASIAELRTFRLPEDLGTGDDFEIDDQHVRNLLLWVKHKAYSIPDTETYDPKAAEKFRNQWDTYCAAALREQSRLRHTAGNVAYGGI